MTVHQYVMLTVRCNQAAQSHHITKTCCVLSMISFLFLITLYRIVPKRPARVDILFHLTGSNFVITWSTVIDLSDKSHGASDKYPTTHNFVTEMCTCVHISVTKWCIAEYWCAHLCYKMVHCAILVFIFLLQNGVLWDIWCIMGFVTWVYYTGAYYDEIRKYNVKWYV